MSEIRLSLSAYRHNLASICEKAGGKERVMLVLKDNAYGHGASLVAKEASDFGIKFCVVKNEREAEDIASNFAQILVLSHIANGGENEKFIYAINCLDDLARIKQGSKIHLKIDTLMHRNGIVLNEIDAAFELILRRNLKLTGAFTHFRASDELNSQYFVQRANFKEAKEKISRLCKKHGMQEQTFHSHNSAGLERVSDLEGEMVRVGIAQHGYAQFDESLNLKPVLSLWAQRVSRRELKAGQGVGYGAVWTAKQNLQTATYDLGYGDGLLRYNGAGELRLANGAPILGKMSMDSFVVRDGGEWVCVFDDARVWAEFFGTISYDVLVKLSPNIRRVWSE